MYEYDEETIEDVVKINTFLCNSMPNKILNIYIDNAWWELERFKDSFPSLLPCVWGQISIHRSYITTQEMIKQIFEFSVNWEELKLRYNHVSHLDETFFAQSIQDYKIHTLDLHLTYLPDYDDGSDPTRMTTDKLRNMLNALSNTNLPETLKLVYMYHDQNWEDESNEERCLEIFREYGFNNVKISSDDRWSLPSRAEGQS